MRMKQVKQADKWSNNMEDLETKQEEQENAAVEKVSLTEIKQNKDDEIVDKIMQKILKIK